jgi:alkanesulfonate monooxygenase SsuD/methylene tetrahydromethanopterin reductase-like flavin-dependent oxidoreductase (luciferase family)
VAVVTKQLKLATGICLVIQRDTIQTAKLVASLDQISGGRFIFGIGGGWNAEELEDHGTVYVTLFKKTREQIEAMKEIWTKDAAEHHGDIIDFPPMQTWPKPVQKPHPPIIVGGAFKYAARRAIRYGDGLIPQAPEAGSGEPEDYMPPVTLGGASEAPDRLKRYRDIGIARMNVRLPPAKADEILPMLDRWAALIRQVQS